MRMDEMDALATAPKHHRLIFENVSVRVLETVVRPGETVPLHTHCWPSTMVVISGSDFVRRDAHGEVTLDSRAAGVVLEAGQALWSGPLPLHTFENVGETVVHVINVEIKPPASNLVP